MIKYIDKKMLRVKILYIITGAFLLAIASLLSKLKVISTKTYIVNAVFIIFSMFFTILAIVAYHKVEKIKKGNLNVINPILSFMLPIILILIYQIPAFGFSNFLGVNNSIIMIYLFSLYSFFIYDISFILRDKYSCTNKKIGTTVPRKYYLYKILKCFAMYIVIMSFVFAIINLFDPKFDVSFLLQFFDFDNKYEWHFHSDLI